MIALADDELPLLYGEEGAELMQKSVDTTFGCNPEREAEANAAAIARILRSCSRDETVRRFRLCNGFRSPGERSEN